MKKWMLYLATVCVVALGQQSCKSKPSDADLQKLATEAISKLSDMGSLPMISVKDGVATLTGEVKDDAAKTAFATAVSAIKGIKSVANQITVAPPPAPAPATVEVSADDALTKAVKDVVKDYGSVTADVKDGIVTLTGNIQKSQLQKLIMALNTLKPKKIDNKLTIK